MKGVEVMDFYKKIVEPILHIKSDDLRRLAFKLENEAPENDDNLLNDTRKSTAEVLNRLARTKDFTDWILSDELGEELDELTKE
jgi:hypothetical protein